MDKLTQDGTSTITREQFLALYPNTSFPVQIPYADFGWFVVAPAPQPTFDPITQSVAQGNPTFDAGAQHWIQTWSVVQLSPEQIAANQAAAKAQHNANIRTQLDALDLKRIRPTAEGDTAYLATLNAQAVALRSQLQ